MASLRRARPAQRWNRRRARTAWRTASLAVLSATPFAAAQAPGPAPPDPPTFAERVRALAAERAGRGFEAAPEVDEALADLDYDRYRKIRLRPEDRIWAGEDANFQIDPLHVGGLYHHAVDLHLVVDGRASPIAFSPTMFDYGGVFENGTAFETAGFSGLRVRSPLNRPEVHDEVVVFQGASYFRAVSRGLQFGTSARGLAIRTAEPGGEEFPRFRSFWIERPEPQAQSIRIHALLDSESVTGAYSFVITPGDETTIDVDMTLFARRKVESLGIAPLTSMFLFAAVNRHDFDDFREAVHDANGLQMVSGSGDRLWRPLHNPKELEVSHFLDEDPKGFGLTQRPRAFADYQDLEARYDKRPSVWVEPLKPFGKGSVTLVEIPTDAEFNDNITAFWKPDRPLEVGEPATWQYRLHVGSATPDAAPVARVEETRSGRAPNNANRLFAIDFVEPDGASGAPRVVAEASAGEIVVTRLEKLPSSAVHRVMVEFRPGEAADAEFRVQLVREDATASEVWLHRWNR